MTNTKLLWAMMILLETLFGARWAVAAYPPPPGPKPLAAPGEFVVKSRSRDVTLLDEQLAQRGLELLEVINRNEGLVVAKVRNESLRDLSHMSRVMADVAASPEVAYIEPNYFYYTLEDNGVPSVPSVASVSESRDVDLFASTATSVTPNDPLWSSLWGMRAIHADWAWALSTGSRQVVVGIVDTGMNFNHPDLRANLWSKPGAPNVHGYNAVYNNEYPMDDNNHGTHCAGVIGAIGNNRIGVVGINWNVRIMALKFLQSNGAGRLSDAIKAIDYGIQNGANVLSNSWGGQGYSQALGEAVQRAAARGIPFIAAAGNDGHNNDYGPTYPAGYYQLPNVITVAATTSSETLAPFSNYGARSVHIAAPGAQILSTNRSGGYMMMSGTSMATPHVSGAVGLLLSREPNLTPSAVRQRIMNTSDRLNSLTGRVASGGRLNLYRMLLGR